MKPEDSPQAGIGSAAAAIAGSTARSRAERMYERFRGLDRAYGCFTPAKGKQPGEQKLEGRYATKRGAVSLGLFECHLAGRQGLGLNPTTDQDTCRWGAIDIDVYDGLRFDVLEGDIARLGLPLIVVKSKSGGAHPYAFTSEPVPAELMQSKLKEWAAALGYPRAEVFPKQARLDKRKDELGNWINLPYFGGDNSTRHAVVDGIPLTVDQFLDLAEEKATSRAELEAMVLGSQDDVEDLFYEGPPCLKRLAKEGWAEDYRNQWLFDVGVYLRKRYGDDFADKLDEYNELLAQPLGHKEVAHILKNLGKKDYNYKCKDEPICSVCDRETCVLQQFGVEERHDVGRKKKESWFAVLQRVLEEATYELWHTPDKQPFVSLTIGTHREHVPVASTLVKQFLVRGYFEATGKPIPMEGLKAIITLLESQAVLDGPEYPLALRLAWHEGAVYWDLANEDREVVRIDAAGRTIVTDPPVRFFRPPGMRPLPRPERGGTIEALRPFVTIHDPNDWRLLIGFVVGCLRPAGPYWQLHVHGIHGAAKSTLSEIIIALVDPQAPPTRALSESERDLAIGAREAHLLAFDNVSVLPKELSDPLCRMSTGGGLGIRKLYSNDEQQRFEVMRPIVLNGIVEVANRPDLRDRAILLDLPAIEDEQRKDSTTFWSAFEAERPLILGALCDAVSCALRYWNTTVLRPAPRMADAARWVAAAEVALGWERGSFLASYAAHRDERAKQAIDNDALAAAAVELAEQDNYQLTPTKALRALTSVAGPDIARQPFWPKTPRALRRELKRLIPDLAKGGVVVKFWRGDSRWIFIGQRGRAGEPKTTYDEPM